MGGCCSNHSNELPPPPRPGQQPNPYGASTFIALYDYTAHSPQDLSFCKGDLLEILHYDGEWWLAKSLKTNQKGFVPYNYVERSQSELANLWFFPDLKRRSAELRLLQSNVGRGGFLIRNCESLNNHYALSIRDSDCVKHYRIRKHETGNFFISFHEQFSSLSALVDHYKHNKNGLCCKLGDACQRIVGSRLGSDVWEVPRNSIKLIKKLGAGHFGEVWSGTWNGNISVAIKKMKVGAMKSDDFLREAAVMKKLRHDHLIQLLAVCSEGEPILIITELMENGSLLDFLNGKIGRRFNIDALIGMSAQVASGMEYLEKKNFIHRDLAARNILVNKQHLCKVADFGLARLMDEDVYSPKEDTRFPVKWTAIEAILYQRFSIKSDVWSFGILLYEVITKGRIPYPDKSNPEVINCLQRGYRMAKPEINPPCPDALYEIMLTCWKANPDHRPTFEFLHNALENFSAVNECEYNDTNNQDDSMEC